MQKTEIALQTLERFLETNPNHLMARLRVGEIQWQLENKREAITIWRQVPKSDSYFAHQSAAIAKRADVTLAQPFAEMAQLIHSEPTYEKRLMYKELCRGWKENGQPEKALPWCEFAAQAVHDGWTQLALAQAQAQLAHYDDALASLQDVYEKGPAELKGKAARQMGGVYLATGRLPEAIDAYETALAEGLSDKWVQMGFAKALLLSGQVEKACLHFEQARELGYEVSPAQRRSFSACD